MNKLTKASIATAAGVVLLLGGGGTLAYWNSSTTVGSASISSGTLSVAAAGTATATDQNGATVDSSFRAVPGDTITIEQDVTLTATGDNLTFEVALTEGALSGDQELIDELLASATYSVAGTNITNISGDEWSVATNGTSTVTVSVEIAWDFGTAVDNDSKNKSVAVAAASFTVTQTA